MSPTVCISCLLVQGYSVLVLTKDSWDYCHAWGAWDVRDDWDKLDGWDVRDALFLRPSLLEEPHDVLVVGAPNELVVPVGWRVGEPKSIFLV